VTSRVVLSSIELVSYCDSSVNVLPLEATYPSTVEGMNTVIAVCVDEMLPLFIAGS
jgi:hypothetical protein